MPAASALGTRASGAHASEDAPPVRRRAVTLAPRPGSRRRNARAQRIPHAGRTPAHPGGQNTRAPRRAERPRPQADGTPAHPGGRDARAPRRTGRPRTQADGTPAHPGGRNARAPRRAARPRPQADGTPAHPGRSCLNLQPRSPRFSSRRSSQAHSSSVRRTSSAARLAANSSGVRHPTSA